MYREEEFQMFSENAIADLKFYVYLLVDPRDDSIFYVGKGNANRVFDHEQEVGYSRKNIIIAEILALGLGVKKYIVHSGLTKDEAFAAETALNNLLRFKGYDLTNEQTAVHLIDECCLAEEYDRRHSKEPLSKEDFSELQDTSCVFLNFNCYSKKNTWAEAEYEELVKRYSFSKKSDLPEIVFVVRKGIVYSCYRVTKWRSEEKQYANSIRTYYYIDETEPDTVLEARFRFANVSSMCAKTTKRRVISIPK